MSILLLGFDTESDIAAGNEVKDNSVPIKSFKDYYLAYRRRLEGQKS